MQPVLLEALTWMLYGTAAAAGLMLLLWLIHFAIRNASIVDPGWAASLALIAIIYAHLGERHAAPTWFLMLMVAIWGLRLSLFLLFTRVIGHPEEGRYVELRRKWGSNIGLKFLVFFQAQAILAGILSLPFALVMRAKATEMTAFEFAGGALWMIAYVGETLADLQLLKFKKNPKNKGEVCNIGLWRFSRHPNYFFEWLIWMGYAVYAFPAPLGPLALIMPATMLFFLFKLTGIPATEEQSLRSRGDKYRAYQRTTSVFVPWFPKKG